MYKFALIYLMLLMLSACSAVKPIAINSELVGQVSEGMPAIDNSTAIYELAVRDGVTYQDVVDSLKSISVGMNFVNPANFPLLSI